MQPGEETLEVALKAFARVLRTVGESVEGVLMDKPKRGFGLKGREMVDVWSVSFGPLGTPAPLVGGRTVALIWDMYWDVSPRACLNTMQYVIAMRTWGEYCEARMAFSSWR